MLPAFFVASIVPSLNADDVNENGSAEIALWTMHSATMRPDRKL